MNCEDEKRVQEPDGICKVKNCEYKGTEKTPRCHKMRSVCYKQVWWPKQSKGDKKVDN